MPFVTSGAVRTSSAFAIGVSLLLAGCGGAPPHREMLCPLPAPPAAGSGGRATLSVLTYNIEGLGWPARKGRAAQLGEIGRHLAALREAGHAPDVVMFQEMFSGAAKKAVAATGYPAIVSGPRRTTRPGPAETGRLPGKARLKRGELRLRLLGSGLAIASRYPIVDSAVRSYGRRSCAGYDCLANKGILLARIVVPGLPSPIDLYDTHFNSRRASGVAAARNLAAHDRQALEASHFVGQTKGAGHPVIFGGDFNMRGSPERWDNFSRYHPLTLVHRACIDPASGCDVRMSWDGDAPWMDTQDLQFFSAGDRIALRPIRVEAMFDGSPGNPVLSDHDGFMVTYELRWSPALPAWSGCGRPIR